MSRGRRFSTIFLRSLPGVALVLFCSVTPEASGTVYVHGSPARFAWSPAAGAVDHYNVYVSVDGQPGVLSQQDAGTTCQISVADGHRYTVQVEAESATGSKGPLSQPSEEITVFLNGSEPDTDGDGMDNAWETLLGFDPLDPQDANQDADADGPLNRDEYLAGTAPRNSDTDSDGVADGLEVQAGTNPLEPADNRPTAQAGPDQESDPTRIVLDGSLSTDPNGDPLAYVWSQLEGPTVSLADPGTARPSFVATHWGLYRFQLVVHDGRAASVADEVTVTIHDVAPTADAGADQVVNAGSRVVLDGSGSLDPNEDSLTYAWHQTGGAPVLLEGAALPSASFCPNESGLYVFALVVNDSRNTSTPDEVQILVHAGNRVPTADAGPDQQGLVNQPVVLDASGSADPDGDPLTYHWSEMEGPEPVLFQAQAFPQVTFTPTVSGTYGFGLTVDDGKDTSALDTISVIVEDSNHAPVAAIQAVGTVAVGARLTLDGRLSQDPDGDLLNYEWTQVGGPAVSLEAADTAEAACYAVIEGVLTFQLVVDDGALASTPATVEVVVEGPNRAPVAKAGKDFSSFTGAKTALDGSASYDPDPGDRLTYSWSQRFGTKVTLEGAATARPAFTTTRGGIYVFDLVVSDGELKSARDSVTIFVFKK